MINMSYRYVRSEMNNRDLDGYYRNIEFDNNGVSRDEFTQIDFDEDVEFFTEEFGSEDIAVQYVLERVMTTYYDEYGQI